MLRVSVVAACLVAGLMATTSVQAQEIGTDFPGQLQPTLPANEELVSQIGQGLPATDLSTLSDQAGTALSVGTDLEQQLSDLLPIAPDDAARSRISGVLTHIQASVGSLQLAQMETSVDSARARFDQARGEAQEALSELQPFVVSLPSVTPIAGK